MRAVSTFKPSIRSSSSTHATAAPVSHSAPAIQTDLKSPLPLRKIPIHPPQRYRETLRAAFDEPGESMPASVRDSFRNLPAASVAGQPRGRTQIDKLRISSPYTGEEVQAQGESARLSSPEPRRTIENRTPFEQVRIHRGPSAAAASAALGARAFTLGNDIYFGAGRYDPSSVAGRGLIGHELTHVTQADSESVIRCDSEDPSWTERLSKAYDEKKWDVYRALIAGLKKARQVSFNALRSQVPRLPGLIQSSVMTVIDTLDFIADMCNALLLAIIGLAVGFVEGIVGLVTGIIKLLYGLLKLVTEWFFAVLGSKQADEALRDDVNNLVKAVQNIPPGLKIVFDNWIERYKKAPAEEQVLMGAELVGQIEAFIATFALAGSSAGKAAGAGADATESAGAAIRIGGNAAALARAPAVAVSATAVKTVAEGSVISSQALMMSNSSSGGPGGVGGGGGGGGPVPAAVDAAKAQVEQDINAERASVAAKKGGMSPAEWARARGGSTKRLYNLLERRAVLTRMKIFPGKTFLEQATVEGVESGGKLTPTAEISATGKGRIADVLEVDGSQGTLEDFKSANTQVKSVKGGMSDPDIEANFRSSSEIAQQHKVEEQVIANAKASGGKVVVTGEDPLSGAKVTLKLDPDKIASKVTDYTDIGGN
jgi:hypothetical protein